MLIKNVNFVYICSHKKSLYDGDGDYEGDDDVIQGGDSLYAAAESVLDQKGCVFFNNKKITCLHG